MIVTQGKKTLDIPILGTLLWWGMRDLRIPRQNLINFFQVCNIPEEYMPVEPNASDAFKKATKTLEKKNIVVSNGNGNTLVANILVREVSTTNEEVTRQITRELVDAQGKRLQYDKIAEIRFDKDTSNVNLNVEQSFQYEYDYATHCAKFFDEYDSFKNNHDANAIRNTLRDILKKCHATPMRPSGGIYFVTVEHTTLMEALEQLIPMVDAFAITTTFDRSEFKTIPVLDIEKQQDLIKEKVEEDIEHEVMTMISDLKHQVDSGEIMGIKRLNDFLLQTKEIRDKAFEYNKVLKHKVTVNEVQLNVVANYVKQLLDKRMEVKA